MSQSCDRRADATSLVATAGPPTWPPSSSAPGRAAGAWSPRPPPPARGGPARPDPPGRAGRERGGGRRPATRADDLRPVIDGVALGGLSRTLEEGGREQDGATRVERRDPGMLARLADSLAQIAAGDGAGVDDASRWPSGPIVAGRQPTAREVEALMEQILCDEVITADPAYPGLSRRRLREKERLRASMRRLGIDGPSCGRMAVPLLVWMDKAGVLAAPEQAPRRPGCYCAPPPRRPATRSPTSAPAG